MNKEAKIALSKDLVEKLKNTKYFYIIDAAGLTVEKVNKFRRLCDSKNITYTVYKNSIIRKSLDQISTDYQEIKEKILINFSGILFSKDSGNVPAQVILAFRKKERVEKPLLKGASIDGEVYIGEQYIKQLSALKSKKELLADVVLSLQTPMNRLLSAVNQGPTLLALLDAIGEKKES